MPKDIKLRNSNIMDFTTNTDDQSETDDIEMDQENILLEIIKELCHPNSELSSNLKKKVAEIISRCDSKKYTSLEKTTVDESTSTLLGFMYQMAYDLTFEEQADLNHLVLKKIEDRIPLCLSELQELKKTSDESDNIQKQHVNYIKEREKRVETLQEQEHEKMELLMEWLNFRINSMTSFSGNSTERLALKSKILDMKSKILHLQMLQNIFTETNQSIKAYSEMHKDLKQTIKETEQRIKNYRDLIGSGDN